MAQSLKHLTLGFASGHDLMVPEIKPPAWDSLSPSLSAPLPLTHTLSLSQIRKH